MRHARVVNPTVASLLAVVGVSLSANAGEIILPQIPTDAWYRVVAYTGQAAPGGGVWTELNAPVLSATGRVAFVGKVQGLFQQSGIWSEGHTGVGNLQPVAREFLSAPSLVPTTYGAFEGPFNSPMMNESGEIVFSAFLFGETLPEDAIGLFRVNGGVVEPVALPFWPAPGGGLYSEISNLPSMNNAGEVVFSSNLIGNGVTDANNSGVYRISPSDSELVFRKGDPIAGILNGKMGDTTFNLPVINDHGVVGVQNWYEVNGVHTWAMWRAEPGGMSFSDLIAREGDASPAGPAYGGGLYGFGQISVNNSGDALFVQSAALATPSETGVWLDRNGAESAVAHWGMPGPLGIQFEFVDSGWAMLNGAGRAIFETDIAGPGLPNDASALFYRDGAGPAGLIAISGQQAPGMPNGVEFSGYFSSRAVNQDGRVAYHCQIEGPGVTGANDFGIWMSRGNPGNADLVIYEGQKLSVGGQLRTVSDVGFRSGKGPESGRRGAFNENNQLGMLVEFEDGTQAVIVATVTALCPGDLNGDGMVNGADLAALLAQWGACQQDFCGGDLVGNGVINGADLASLLASWGSCQ